MKSTSQFSELFSLWRGGHRFSSPWRRRSPPPLTQLSHNSLTQLSENIKFFTPKSQILSLFSEWKWSHPLQQIRLENEALLWDHIVKYKKCKKMASGKGQNWFHPYLDCCYATLHLQWQLSLNLYPCRRFQRNYHILLNTWPDTCHLRHWLHCWQLRTTLLTITLWPLNNKWQGQLFTILAVFDNTAHCTSEITC